MREVRSKVRTLELSDTYSGIQASASPTRKRTYAAQVAAMRAFQKSECLSTKTLSKLSGQTSIYDEMLT